MLETRQLLSATMTLQPLTGLKVDGTDLDDVATIEAVDADNIRVRVVSGEETVEPVFSLVEVSHSMEFNGFSGNDKLTCLANYSTKMYGDAGNDTLLGGPAGDDFWGGDGDDRFDGGAGSSGDRSFGGEGNDSLAGGGGADWLQGDNGNDTLNGDSGNDIISGGGGTDLINGGTGSDHLRESISGQYVLAQNSMLSTDSVKNFESASITGSTSSDTINLSGFTFPATISGGDGSDTLIARRSMTRSMEDLVQTRSSEASGLTCSSKMISRDTSN